ncbi:hypothetical protein BUALT_Bualt04G0161200 [Buddleja alternifolia]|uniref:Cysteine-rich receptor-like protein kinase 42 n=1 Tax=Buddleja alternifolia TaxID=168488 RepID=A0AAV6XQN9_9LAMI|nr:hypothetical protein BUALT_Bualt04G0161200 [Buddleja alternifolia]
MNLSTHLPWIIIFIFMIPFTLSDPRISEAGLFCGQNRSASPNYIPLFTSSMEVLSQRVTESEWGFSSTNSTNITIYNLAQCHGDLTRDDCLQCYAASRTRIPRCVPSIAGRIFLDGCFIRYDSYAFYNESVDALDTRNCNTSLGVEAYSEFGRNVGQLVDRLIVSAVGNRGYAVRGSRGVFGLAQCWNTVSRDGCSACLEKARREVRACLPSREGRALNTGCYLRYSTERFYSNRTGQANQNSGSSRTRALAISLSVVAFCMLCLFAGYAVYKRWKKRKQARSNLGKISYSYNKSKLNFKYETLEKATNYFDDTRKLGQGGAGSVYKGTLPNGKIVAVKRLFFSTRQWVDEFFNEINLISGIEHKNLVKLLGCSIEGPESLLVYEYVANRSLEQHIFDTLTESVDTNLKGDFPAMEASKVLRIGLLCAQASVAHRPSMAEVVRMLTDENCEIPEPNQPPFLNTGVHSASSTRSSYSANSSTSNRVTKHGASDDPSSESFSIQSSDGLLKSEDFRQK